MEEYICMKSVGIVVRMLFVWVVWVHNIGIRGIIMRNSDLEAVRVRLEVVRECGGRKRRISIHRITNVYPLQTTIPAPQLALTHPLSLSLSLFFPLLLCLDHLLFLPIPSPQSPSLFSFSHFPIHPSISPLCRSLQSLHP